LHRIDPVGYIEFLAEILKGNGKKGKYLNCGMERRQGEW